MIHSDTIKVRLYSKYNCSIVFGEEGKDRERLGRKKRKKTGRGWAARRNSVESSKRKELAVAGGEKTLQGGS